MPFEMRENQTLSRQILQTLSVFSAFEILKEIHAIAMTLQNCRYSYVICGDSAFFPFELNWTE